MERWKRGDGLALRKKASTGLRKFHLGGLRTSNYNEKVINYMKIKWAIIKREERGASRRDWSTKAGRDALFLSWS